MEATAKVTFVRIAPRKVQIVLDLIRNNGCESFFQEVSDFIRKYS